MENAVANAAKERSEWTDAMTGYDDENVKDLIVYIAIYIDGE